MLTLKMICDARDTIWNDEASALNIVYDVSTSTDKVVFYAECENTCTSKRLTISNYRDVLNDMFYDYCVENASWMGVS